MLKPSWTLAAAWLLLSSVASPVACAASTAPSSSSPYLVDAWEVGEEGLPQSSVIAMTQTRDNYLWLGTYGGGLARFDGIRFEVFDENNTPGLRSSVIVHLFEDSQGELWIGTETAGIALLKDGKVTSFDIGRGARESKLVSVCEDAAGAVWFYTANGQLGRYRAGQVDLWKFGADYPSACRLVIAEKSGPLWVGVDWGLYGMGPASAPVSRELPLQQVLPVQKLDFLLASQRGGHWRLANGRVQHWRTNQVDLDFGAYPWSSTVRVTAACEDQEGNLIVGTLNAGVFWYDAAGKSTKIQGLSHDGILSLCMDREDSLWVGTDGGGLNRVKRKKFAVAAAARDWVVQSVCEDGTGGLWMGFNGGGATYWKDGVVQDFGPGEGLIGPREGTPPNFSAVLVDRSRRVWVGTRGEGLFQWQTNHFQPAPGSSAINRNILAIYQDRAGMLWAGTQGGLARWNEREWKTFTTRDGLSAEVVRAIVEDAEGNLWIGTERGGLNRMANGQFTSFHVKDGLPSENISSLHVDAEGVLWVGTSGGLARWDGGKWTRYTRQQGLASNSVGYLLEDGQGYLWLGSNAGLVRVAKKVLTDFANGQTRFISCRTYGKPDGLPTAECTQGSQPAACRTRDGRLWFPTIRGLVSVDPVQLSPNTNPPPVLIESVKIDGQEQNTNSLRTSGMKSVTIPAGKERLEIRYTSLNLAAPERARFKFLMERHETDWTDAGNSRIARYPKLPPGEYRFRVKACNEDGVWNETGSSLAIIALPSFWQTWWFRSLVVACWLAAVVAAVRYVSTQKLQRQLQALRQQEAVEKERSRIARDLHDQLGASLTQVALLGELAESDKDSPHEVEAHARQISQTARETTGALDEIVWEANPSNDTLDSLITYACKYAQEYLVLAGLRYRLDVPETLPAAPIPPDVRHNVFLAFKEAVNNVVKHAQASSAQVRLRLEPKRFTLEIQDDGRGLAGREDKIGRNGLHNMRKRMEDISGDFSVGPAPEGGTLVRLTAPLGKH